MVGKRRAGGGGEHGEVKENYPERDLLRLRWAVLAAGGTALLLLAAAALDARLPAPLTRANGSDTDFIAEIAYEHLVNLTSIGPRVAGTYENEVLAVGVVVEAVKRIAAGAAPHTRVEFDVHTASGAFPLAFMDGMTHMYRDVQSVVVRLRGAGARPARSALLLNCHYDTVPDSPGASDDGAGCAVVLETLRALAAGARPRHDVLALLNGAEENVLQASHAFVAAHRWAGAARAFLNIEACGSGGREVLFQAGPGEPWLLEAYAAAAPHPFASSLAQELFQSGLIPADTDFRIFRDFGNLSGLDLAWSSNGYVYHTHLDTADRIPLAALQRTGDNVLAVVRHLLAGEQLERPESRGESQPVFFDVLGVWVVAARAPQALAAVVGTLLLVAAKITLNRRQAERELFLAGTGWARAAGAAGGGALGGAAAGLAAAALLGAALSAARARLAFYAHPLLLAPLYALPALAASWLAGRWAWEASAWSRRVRGAWAARAWSDAGAALAGAALAAGAACGLRSAFVPLVWAAPAAAADLLAHAARAPPIARLAAAAAAAAPPALQTAYLALASLNMFVPIMGRAGTTPLPPDVIMGLVVAALTMTVFSGMLPLIMAARRPKRLIYALAAVSAAAAAAVACGATGGAYSAARPQRLMVFHTRRTVHSARAAPHSDHFYWVPELDANTPDTLRHLAAEEGVQVRESSAEECAAFPYCGAPYYLPVASLVARGLALPAPPLAPAAATSAALATAPLNSTLQMLYINITGPSHVALVVSPAAGARLGAAAALRGARPAAGPRWRDARGDLRDTYFFALHQARRPQPWLLELPIEHSLKAAPPEWAAVSVAGHALGARGPALDARLRALAAAPLHLAPTGWPVDLHLHTV